MNSKAPGLRIHIKRIILSPFFRQPMEVVRETQRYYVCKYISADLDGGVWHVKKNRVGHKAWKRRRYENSP